MTLVFRQGELAWMSPKSADTIRMLSALLDVLIQCDCGDNNEVISGHHGLPVYN